jgi:hypothetical protein
VVRETGAELERYYLAGVVDRLPIAVMLSRATTPRLLPIAVITAKRIQGLREVFANERPAITPPRRRAVAGAPGLTYDVSYTLRGRSVFQRFVDFNRGTTVTFTLLFTAPTRRAFDRYASAFERIVRRWRWRD